MHDDNIFDVAVIGGGPAGLMAAGRAAELGAKVVLIEKNPKPGRKLLMTGNGRCNLTHAEYDTRKMVETYGKNGKFLFSSFSVFGVKETVEFFERRGLPLRVEEDGRVFPESDRAADVLKLLLSYLKSGRVAIEPGATVTGLEKDDSLIARARLEEGPVKAGSFIVCTGGRSYPSTGSTGEGLEWMRRLGHTVTRLAPALAPVTVKEGWVKEAEGASFRGLLSVYQSGKRRASEAGEGVFTHNGLSGPAVLNLSRAVRELSGAGETTLSLDLVPDMRQEELDKRLQLVFEKNRNRLLRNCLADFATPKLVPLILRLSMADGGRQVNSVTRAERLALTRTIKGLEFTVKGVGGFERAMVTSGGVALKEIDPRTMRSKVVENLYLAGEILDIDGPTGGYNLQACWSTGYSAGSHAADAAGVVTSRRS